MKSTDESRTRTGEAGFTLVEAMIAILVLVFGLMAIANLFVVATTSNLAASQGTAAVNMAAQQMEAIKAAQFGTILTGGNVEADVTGFVRFDLIPGVGQIRTRWQVTAVDNATYFVRVRSESTALLGQRTRAELTSFRACSATVQGCPAP